VRRPAAALALALLAAGPAAAASRCREAFSRLDADPPIDLAQKPAAAAAAVKDYATCLAVARRDLSACRALRTYKHDPRKGFTSDLKPMCLGHAAEQLLARAVVSKDAGACAALVETAGLAGAAAAPRACAAMIEDAARPAELCRRLPPLLERPLDDCLNFFSALGGDADACSKERNPHASARCLDYVVFALAHRARDAGRCGDSLACRLMMTGKPALCAPLAKAAADAACAP
jgi:hypothetical protein